MIKKIAKFELRCERHGITVKSFFRNLWTIIVDIVFVISAFDIGLSILCIPLIVWHQLSLPTGQCQGAMSEASSLCWGLLAVVAVDIIVGIVSLIIHVHQKIRRTKKEIASK